MSTLHSRARYSALALVSVAFVSACTGSSVKKAEPSPSPTLTPVTSATPSSTKVTIPGSPTPLPVPTLAFKGCGGGFECAAMAAPLDYAHPGLAQISISVIRHHVKNSNGALLINPGGPGASGVNAVRVGLPFVSALQSRKDIIGFDPRGTGGSTSIACGTHIDEFVATDSSPDNQAEVNQLKAVSKQLADECLTKGGKALLSHVTTADAARDMDLLRAALHLDRLDYLGYSYGTLLGAIYTEMFPARIGRFVLDGVLDPKLSARDIEIQQAVAFEDALNSLLDSCGSGCPFKRKDSPDVKAEYDRLAASVDSTPLPTGETRKLTQALFTLGVAAGLYDRARGWDAIKSGLAQAQGGDGSGLLRLSDSYTDRHQDGSYPTTLAAMYAVNCTDRPLDGGLTGLTNTATEIKKRAPRLGPTVVWLDMPCVVWPVAPIGKAHSIDVASPFGRNVVIVGTTRDPATPYVNAQSLHGQIKGSRLVTFDGDGHTAVGRSGCVDRLVSAWLIDGTLPPEGSRC